MNPGTSVVRWYGGEGGIVNQWYGDDGGYPGKVSPGMDTNTLLLGVVPVFVRQPMSGLHTTFLVRSTIHRTSTRVSPEYTHAMTIA